MFGLINSDGLEPLKVTDANRERFEAVGADKHGRMPYSEVPSDVLGDSEALNEWAKEAMDFAHASKKKWAAVRHRSANLTKSALAADVRLSHTESRSNSRRCADRRELDLPNILQDTPAGVWRANEDDRHRAYSPGGCRKSSTLTVSHHYPGLRSPADSFSQPGPSALLTNMAPYGNSRNNVP